MDYRNEFRDIGMREDFEEIQERLERVERLLWDLCFELLALPSDKRQGIADDIEKLQKFIL
jgi:hypothetical protein